MGRKLARNLAPEAVNIEVSGISGVGNVHANTVHEPEVICRALYTAVHHQTPPAGFECQDSGGIPVIPPRVAIVPVLDISGSMLYPACPGCAPKEEVLRRAVEIFVGLWATVADGGDRVGVTYFGTQVSGPDTGGQPLIELTLQTVQSVVADVGAHPAAMNNMTAMGGGLQDTIDALEGPGTVDDIPHRHIILFTDGMQNVSPEVVRHENASAPDGFELWIEETTQPPVPLTLLSNGLGINVHTVSVGATEPFMAELEDIATKTDGNAWFTIDPDNDLTQIFTEALIESLRGNSPQLIAYRRGTLKEGSKVETFEVGRRAARVVFKLSWKRGTLDFAVKKDGVDLTRCGHHTPGSFYRIYALDPARPAGGCDRVESEGEWQVVISGRPGVRYEVAAIVDQPALRYEFAIDDEAHAVGDPLELSVTLAVDGRPVDEVDLVEATVLAPRESIGTVLSVEPEPAAPAGFSMAGARPEERKLHLLLQDDQIRQRLRPAARKVTLQDRGDGTFGGTFSDTHVPGAYRVLFEVAGEDSLIGRFRRSETRTAVVRFSEPAVAALTVAEFEQPDGRRLRLHLRPQDVYGNYLGPGYADRIAVSPDSLAEAAQDEVDGGYSIPLNVPAGEDPDITVSVLGHEVFSGPVSGLAATGSSPPTTRPTRWWLAIVLLILVVFVVWHIARRASPSPP